MNTGTELLPILSVLLLGLGTGLLLPHRHKQSSPRQIHIMGAIVAAGGLGLFLLLLTPPMDWLARFFLFAFAALALAGGILAVTARDPVHNALWFAVVLLATAGLFLLVGAQFLAAGTIIVYAGAIIVTFLFVIMLAQAEGQAPYDRMARSPVRSTLTAFGLLLGLIFAIWRVQTSSYRDLTVPKAPTGLVAPRNGAGLLPPSGSRRGPGGPGGGAMAGGPGRGPGGAPSSGPTASGEAIAGGPGGPGTPPAGPGGPGAGPGGSNLSAPREMTQIKRDLAATDFDQRLVRTSDLVSRALDPMTGKPLGSLGSSPGGEDLGSIFERVLTSTNTLVVGSSEETGRGEPPPHVAGLGGSLFTDHLVTIEVAGAVLFVALVAAMSIAAPRLNNTRTGTPEHTDPVH